MCIYSIIYLCIYLYIYKSTYVRTYAHSYEHTQIPKNIAFLNSDLHRHTWFFSWEKLNLRAFLQDSTGWIWSDPFWHVLCQQFPGCHICSVLQWPRTAEHVGELWTKAFRKEAGAGLRVQTPRKTTGNTESDSFFVACSCSCSENIHWIPKVTEKLQVLQNQTNATQSLQPSSARSQHWRGRYLSPSLDSLPLSRWILNWTKESHQAQTTTRFKQESL